MNRSIVLLLAMALHSFAWAQCSTPDGKVRLRIQPISGQTLLLSTELANTDAARTKGLMFRQSLPEGTGMWFVMGEPSRNPFWMRNTYIPLDILFVGKSGQVLHIHENAKPHDESLIDPRKPYWYVLEVPAGFAKRHKLRVGDHIENITPKC